ncbi:tyrosine-type recombinase/integrase [Cupriavidus necator]
MGADDCARYQEFLAQPDAAWMGPKAPRSSARWRPFAGALKPESQRYAVLVLRGFFAWLVGVRYLAGNPWLTVKDPVLVRLELPLAIEKALPGPLWDVLIRRDGVLDRLCTRFDAVPSGSPLGAKDAETPAAQYRLARAALLLLGCSGARREEAARALRSHLQPVPEQAGIPEGLWELALLGKRGKWRTVFLPSRVIEALRAHRVDRGHGFDDARQELALLSPVVLPATPTAQAKHVTSCEGVPALTGVGFSPDGLYRVLSITLRRIAKDSHVPLEAGDRELLRKATPHALRHTFATHAVANDIPLDVLQQLLGHASLQTTSLYVRAERTRGIAATSKLSGTPT